MIRKYQPDDFHILEKWVQDPKLLFTFAGPSWSFPITQQQVAAHQEKFPNKQLYIGLNDLGDPIAIGEIITDEPHSPRLGRLLVGDPALRGKGIGEKFIRELIAECVRLNQIDNICLFVLEENQSAISLYKKIGFIFSEEKIPDMILENQSYPVLKMLLKIADFNIRNLP
ncbi:GNAT family N-acetyltransferase [Flavihumibacter profundi]|jgi:RimJ/RimL family protein N-acetyltransferase|uniref:GNAT family N-acetyltransferase n=1 Tax=Flavihumibacter profundi TaxID=2716883 RepID=UPI001CC64EBF|nr:N-acetyltransferase [Flavihumibacter profundi]MBZ5855965.1 GNAT family N-acetyltransferase [Flavihumibacter profundi]